VVVFFYGGGWHAGERGDYGFAGSAFASQDFVAIVPDYRLVPEVRYPGFLEDAALALRWVWQNIAHYGGDHARIAVAGQSAGAYIAAMLALDPRWLGTVQLPPSTIRAGVLMSGPFDFAPFREWRGRAAFGSYHDPAETQPINHVRSDAPPLLLQHGSSDRLVYAKNSRHLAARLAAVGAPHELRIYQGCDHAGTVVALARPFRGRFPVLADAAAFLRSTLGHPTSPPTR
jgi:acetyl esterase/lipase